VNDVLVLLFSAGAAAFLTAVVSGISKIRSQRAESEEAIIKRLNENASSAHRDAAMQRKGREKAEARLEIMRVERDAALEESSRLYRYIIDHGLPDPRKSDDGR
jgi:hypothetical protein